VRALLFILFVMSGPIYGLSGRNAARANSTVPIALTDLGSSTYHGFEGGLYPGGSNVTPLNHHLEGQQRASAIQPLNTSGQPDPSGRIVMLSVGMSNTNAYYCGSKVPEIACDNGSFMDRAAADPAVSQSRLKLINGARSGAALGFWVGASNTEYDRIETSQLNPQGLSEAQVQVVWALNANMSPSGSLPDSGADAYFLISQYGQWVRELKMRYPNLQQVFFSSRIYGGYATVPLNPEPYAYESGFAVKWLIEAQIDQMNGAGVDPFTGDLDYTTSAPWIDWGAYMWADGQTSRADGLTWEPDDFLEDGTHPSEQGVWKAGGLLLDFFKQSPFTWPWFLESGSTPAPTFTPSLTPLPSATPPPSATPLPTHTSSPTMPPSSTPTITPSATPAPPSATQTTVPTATATATPRRGQNPGVYAMFLSIVR
jgi:hypothetical protein